MCKNKLFYDRLEYFFEWIPGHICDRSTNNNQANLSLRVSSMDETKTKQPLKDFHDSFLGNSVLSAQLDDNDGDIYWR